MAQESRYPWREIPAVVSANDEIPSSLPSRSTPGSELPASHYVRTATNALVILVPPSSCIDEDGVCVQNPPLVIHSARGNSSWSGYQIQYGTGRSDRVQIIKTGEQNQLAISVNNELLIHSGIISNFNTVRENLISNYCFPLLIELRDFLKNQQRYSLVVSKENMTGYTISLIELLNDGYIYDKELDKFVVIQDVMREISRRSRPPIQEEIALANYFRSLTIHGGGNPPSIKAILVKIQTDGFESLSDEEKAIYEAYVASLNNDNGDRKSKEMIGKTSSAENKETKSE